MEGGRERGASCFPSPHPQQSKIWTFFGRNAIILYKKAKISREDEDVLLSRVT